ncbi:MAG: hypothetical protein IJC45_03310, partial [Clostridia bacterium]|nr:hypothetical protein [Clostridia bacterium]
MLQLNYDLALYAQCKLLRQYLKIFGQAFAKACGSRAAPLSPIAMGETPLSPKKRRRVEKQLSIVFRREPSPGVLYCAKGTTITNDL